ncbi:MAG: hypothetical protein U9P38_03975 [Campylobacterota bacterium]|nr:hypothetical protein [Campylobacterota bacterium]
MKYSFIQPRVKSAFTPEMKLLLSFFSMTIFMLVSTYLFLIYKDYSFAEEKSTISQKRDALDLSISRSKEEVQYIQSEINLSEEIYKHNSVLKESISNLFDLIPSKITLSEARLLENGLILYGITPNKDVYNFMLQAPLRSIFHKTYTSFYPVEDGWIRFVSTNYVEVAELEEKRATQDED